MLILTRKIDETIRIGDDISIKIIDIDNRQVKIGIVAPKHVAINREEIYLIIQKENRAASIAAVAGRRVDEGLMNLAGLLKKSKP